MIDERSIHHKTSPGRYRNLDSKWEHCSLGDTIETKDGYASLCACKILCTSCNDLANPNGRELITLYKTVQQIMTTRRQQVASWGFTWRCSEYHRLLTKHTVIVWLVFRRWNHRTQNKWKWKAVTELHSCRKISGGEVLKDTSVH